MMMMLGKLGSLKGSLQLDQGKTQKTATTDGINIEVFEERNTNEI